MTTREEIKPLVIVKLKAITDMDDLAEIESSDLKRDLGMTSLLIQAMSRPYSKIACSYPSGVRITISDASKCETVKDSIDLVLKRAKGNKK